MRRADRLFELIQVLRRARKAVTATQLAEKLEVAPRTVYRDVAALMAMRVPIDGAATTRPQPRTISKPPPRASPDHGDGRTPAQGDAAEAVLPGPGPRPAPGALLLHVRTRAERPAGAGEDRAPNLRVPVDRVYAVVLPAKRSRKIF